MQNDEIEVLIPCAGDAKYFHETMVCLQKQTYVNFRVTVCDNGCVHNRYEEIASQFSAIKVTYIKFKDRLPMTRNWQRCLDTATAGVVCFLHDDDVWAANYLESSVERLNQAGADFCLTHNIATLADGTFHQGFKPPVPVWEEVLTWSQDKIKTWIVLSPGPCHMSAVMFRKRAIGFDLTLSWIPDIQFINDYCAHGVVTVNPHSTASIRFHGGSQTTEVTKLESGKARWKSESQVLLRDAVIMLKANNEFSVAAIENHPDFFPSQRVCRLYQACFSWPYHTDLIAVGKECNQSIMLRKGMRKDTSSSMVMASYLPEIGWALFTLIADLNGYFRMRRGQTNKK